MSGQIPAEARLFVERRPDLHADIFHIIYDPNGHDFSYTWCSRESIQQFEQPNYHHNIDDINYCPLIHERDPDWNPDDGDFDPNDWDEGFEGYAYAGYLIASLQQMLRPAPATSHAAWSTT